MLNKNTVPVNGSNFRFCHKVYLYINIFYKINEGNTVFIKFCFHHVLLDIPIFINPLGAQATFIHRNKKKISFLTPLLSLKVSIHNQKINQKNLWGLCNAKDIKSTRLSMLKMWQGVLSFRIDKRC